MQAELWDKLEHWRLLHCAAAAAAASEHETLWVGRLLTGLCCNQHSATRRAAMRLQENCQSIQLPPRLPGSAGHKWEAAGVWMASRLLQMHIAQCGSQAHLLINFGADLLDEVSNVLALRASQTDPAEEGHQLLPGAGIHQPPCMRQARLVRTRISQIPMLMS